MCTIYIVYVYVYIYIYISAVERENAMTELQSQYDIPMGTGYGTDPATINFLKASLAKGSYELPVTRVINSTAQKISHMFWKEGGTIPIPSKHLIGQTYGHGDMNMTSANLYVKRRDTFLAIKAKLEKGEHVTEEEKKVFNTLDMRRNKVEYKAADFEIADEKTVV